MFQRKSEVIGIALPRRLADVVAPKVSRACALSVEQDCSPASCNREPLTRLRDHAKIKTQGDFWNYRMGMVCIARRYAQKAPTSGLAAESSPNPAPKITTRKKAPGVRPGTFRAGSLA